MKPLIATLIFFIHFSNIIFSQTDSSALRFTLSGYAEPYYGYDFNQPEDGYRPGFIYSHDRHHEFNINIAFLKAAVQSKRMRGNLALMAGTYPNSNLSVEPNTLRNIFEANAGVKISKNHELWVDAGIFSSHIGFESAVGKDCWMLTRGMLAENSPYYEAGAKLSYATPDGKWFFSALALNGWQRIRRVEGNSLLSGGWQVTFKPNERITLNSSGFLGTDRPDDARLIRSFHNLYGIFQLNDQFGLIAGLDTGWEENPREGESPNMWYSPVLIGRYAINDRLALAGRVEYYADENGVIIATGTENGFKTLGVSLNLDVQVHKNAVWRIEGKVYNSKDDIFVKENGDATNSNAVLTTALCVWF